MKKFNRKFMFGAATAAHQVEGNNKNSDFWVLENIPGSLYKEKSLDAVDHYNRYKEDIKILADAGLNSYRFSLEWARIEPSKGNFDKNEIEHYRDMINFCHDNGVTPIVTLHHFSSPRWLISEGGWESETTVEYFGRYCKYVVSELGELMPYICTINEANMGVQIARIMKEYQAKMAKATKVQSANADVQVGINVDSQSSMEKYYRAAGEAFGIDPRKLHTFHDPRTEHGDLIIMKCHEKAREVIKEINPEIKVGLTMSLYDYQAQPGGEELVKKLWDEDFLHYLPYIQEDDFFGVQNYTRKVFGPNGKIEPDENTRLSEVGNEFYPLSLAGVIRFVAKHWKKSIIVTEHGIATSNDKDRVELIEEAIAGLYDCIEEGIDVIGYMHWSLLDNFEWQLGYTPKFGLIAVDRATQIRYPKESLTILGNMSNSRF
ncbi:glycoside hydrolase family 1 protein [Clostridium sp. YIM B02505]|uniref:Glycoside hydrolase family 1 protein n=1 Tax=Clostridium yunnanense TaxID=2800325 RepID=A0ABS1ESK5_9CLOT|nr:family 1 glycosylhydrolase [Clostridium yunnanense]MBK1812283.1 glycoside hydrolase family 1 protein [Clostridium yunnanense]